MKLSLSIKSKYQEKSKNYDLKLIQVTITQENTLLLIFLYKGSQWWKNKGTIKT